MNSNDHVGPTWKMRWEKGASSGAFGPDLQHAVKEPFRHFFTMGSGTWETPYAALGNSGDRHSDQFNETFKTYRSWDLRLRIVRLPVTGLPNC